MSFKKVVLLGSVVLRDFLSLLKLIMLSVWDFSVVTLFASLLFIISMEQTSVKSLTLYVLISPVALWLSVALYRNVFQVASTLVREVAILAFDLLRICKIRWDALFVEMRCIAKGVCFSSKKDSDLSSPALAPVSVGVRDGRESHNGKAVSTVRRRRRGRAHRSSSF